MDISIVDILVLLFKQYPHGLVKEELEPVAKELMAKGYSSQEIESALFWFNNRTELKEIASSMEETDPRSFRVLHEVELGVISTKGWGYLTELHSLGIITISDLNAIIDKAMLLGGQRLDLDEIKLLTASHILHQDSGLPMLGSSFFMSTTTETVQ